MKFLITKLDHPEHCGDWHDRPLKWKVSGPEVQKFSTKKEAQTWVKIRRHTTFKKATMLSFAHEKAFRNSRSDDLRRHDKADQNTSSQKLG
jgi:hypothetical protein